MESWNSPGTLGPVTLRNRTIRSAAFEGMCPGGMPSAGLIDYHRAVARGGVGMTTVAYVAVDRGGLSFPHQAWMSEDVIAPFRELTDAVHREGAAAALQLGHCGNMADRRVSGKAVVAPSRVFNLFGLTLPRAMTESDLRDLIGSFAVAAQRAREAGFDAVEIHGGHGYLLSQFLTPYTNRRRDRWGGSLENRYRLLGETVKAVKEAVGKTMAVVVKMNMRDGFDSGYDIGDAQTVAGWLKRDGADSIVLSGGFVSKTPMYVMRGITPTKDFISSQTDPLIKAGLFFFGNIAIKDFPYKRLYFLDDAKIFRGSIDHPLTYVGGVLSAEDMDTVMSNGFAFIQLARALLAETDFIDTMRKSKGHLSPCHECGPGNMCIGAMYAAEARCTWKG